MSNSRLNNMIFRYNRGVCSSTYQFQCYIQLCNDWKEHRPNFERVGDILYLASRKRIIPMMTSSNGNIFRVTGLLCGEFTTGEFPSQMPVTRSFDVFFDLRLNKWLSKQSWGWWFETPLRWLWRHYNECLIWNILKKGTCRASQLSREHCITLGNFHVRHLTHYI